MPDVRLGKAEPRASALAIEPRVEGATSLRAFTGEPDGTQRAVAARRERRAVMLSGLDHPAVTREPARRQELPVAGGAEW